MISASREEEDKKFFFTEIYYVQSHGKVKWEKREHYHSLTTV